MLHCSFNFHNVIITFLQDLIDHQYTIALVSFRAILNQVMDYIGLHYMGGESFFTRDFRFQAKLSFYRTSQLNTPLFDICSSICGRHWEAEESALVRALIYFDEVLGWTIGDRNYLIYLRMWAMLSLQICNMHGCIATIIVEQLVLLVLYLMKFYLIALLFECWIRMGQYRLSLVDI